MSAILPAITRIAGSVCLLPDPQARRHVIERARWAPSGDNTQPWRFVPTAGAAFAILGHDTRDTVIYDRDGRASQLSLGALLETIRLAAAEVGRRALITRLEGDEQPQAAGGRRADRPEAERGHSPRANAAPWAAGPGAGTAGGSATGGTSCRDRHPRWMVTLIESPAAQASPLAAHISRRCTSRLPFSTRAIDAPLRGALDGAAGDGHRLRWLTGWQRVRGALLMTGFGALRLLSRECFAVHQHIIDWDDRFSLDRLPVDSLGLDPLTRRIMRWALHDWRRASLLNRLGFGTQPRWQLDLLPNLACGAQVAVIADGPVDDLDAQLAAGAAVQRLWLAATAAGLQLQPLYTPVVLGAYVREDRPCFADPALWRRAQDLVQRWDALVGPGCERVVFAARLGFARPPASRSVRLPVEQLLS